ncbi:glycosyltransferase family 2 protein [Arundinibacter roseus]|uniref:Glycosyltransferase n=1 Tax=Arundinibacter roseus TaxID=2070510 RepID=A0A4R4JXF3_9BACT|nr:glycosyltransferase family 2 protein [Arundinibacter roseus]TDB58651.1 glycosyltransferase [Arundinibacter roseus]
MPTLSIITVVYNNVHTVGDTLASVAAQKVRQLEHVVVDGVSTDGTLAVIAGFNSPVVRLTSEPDSGIYNAMNKGIRLATGDIVGFLNADDVYEHAEVLTQVQRAFAENPQADVVFGDLVYVKENDLGKVVRRWKSRPYDAAFFEEGHVPPHPAFFARRSALLASGGFDETFQLAADYELMFRLLKIEQRPSVYMPEVWVRMRLGGATNQSTQNIRRGNQEIVAAWKRHQQDIPLRFWLLRYLRKVKQFW